MKTRFWAVALILMSGSSAAFADDGGRTWLTLGLNLIYGHVDLPCETDHSDCSEAGLLGGFTGAFTTASESGGLFRMRVARIREADTDDDPVEVAALFGTRFGDSSVHGALGVGRIFNPDDELPGHRTGLAWELLFARDTDRDAAFEFAIQGNFAGSAEYVGVNFGLRFGDME